MKKKKTNLGVYLHILYDIYDTIFMFIYSSLYIHYVYLFVFIYSLFLFIYIYIFIMMFPSVRPKTVNDLQKKKKKKKIVEWFDKRFSTYFLKFRISSK